VSTATEFFTGKFFTGLTLLVGVVVVGVGLHAVYVRPTDPPAGTAAIEVTGTPGVRFEGTLWTMSGTLHVEGETPRTFKLAYVQQDLPTVRLHKAPAQSAGTRKVAIRVQGGRTVEEGQAQAEDQYVMVSWQAPPSLNP
jgi:hypothetical protein